MATTTTTTRIAMEPLSGFDCPAWHRLRFMDGLRQRAWRFCDCSDDSVFELSNRPLGEVLDGTNHAGMRDVIACPGGLFANLEPEGRHLVEQCADFLLFYSAANMPSFPKRVTEGLFHKTKYITLWSFIYDHLGIPQDSGYDYWLMNFMDWHNVCEHGSGIRCAYWNSGNNNPLHGRVLSEESRAAIVQWATDASDDI